jgi:hypothetical protein
MPSNPTRRGFIAASLVVPAALPAIDALAIDDPERFRLIQRREYLQSEITKLDRQWTLAYAKLPPWCRPSHKFRDEQGRTFGPTVGWPEIDGHPIQVNRLQWLIRPSPLDLRDLFGEETESMGRDLAALNYRVRIRHLRSRLREQRKVQQCVGLPISRDWLPLDLELEEVDAEISSLSTRSLPRA